MSNDDTPVQLDLFGDVEADLAKSHALEASRAHWQAGFERADWVAPYDCGDGPKGTVVRGWRCHDPECGEVVVNAFVLELNHGFDPTIPGHQPYHGRCQAIAAGRVGRPARASEMGPCPVCGGTRAHHADTYPDRPCLVPAHAQRASGRWWR